MSQTLKTPGNTSSAQKNFYSVRDAIVKAVYANTMPDNLNFDDVIKKLS